MPYERAINVPGAWNAQGAGFASDAQLRRYEDERLEEQKSLNARGILGVQRESDRLFHAFPGPAWYRKRVTIPADWTGRNPWLVFTGVHRDAEVWVNGKSAGTHAVVSHAAPHRPVAGRRSGRSRATRSASPCRVDARRNRSVDPLMGCLDTLDFLYVTWGGIHQPVRLEGVAATWLDDVFVIPRLADSTAEIRVSVAGPKGAALKASAEIRDAENVAVASAEALVTGEPGEIDLAGADRQPETLVAAIAPPLHCAGPPRSRAERSSTSGRFASACASSRSRAANSGSTTSRSSSAATATIASSRRRSARPADKAALRARLARAREYGFNFVRHHSWTPPEDYLEAADELGMMLQPEFPFAYRWDLPKTPEARALPLEQWEAVIRLNRNHPSIVAWCMGNEQYDSFDLAPEMYQVGEAAGPDASGHRLRRLPIQA